MMSAAPRSGRRGSAIFSYLQGDLIYKEILHTANISVEAQLLQNTLVNQLQQARRTDGAKKTRTADETKAHLKDTKSTLYDKQCVGVADSLQRMTAAVEAVAAEKENMDTDTDMDTGAVWDTGAG